MKIILQKYIAESGYCSRRKAEELIRQGKVTVGGKKAELGMSVDRAGVEVRIDGEKLALAKEKIYIKLNKPKGYTCTNRNFKDEKNVFDLLSRASVETGVETRQCLVSTMRLHVVGRLDKQSRGLVLLTNDGELTQRLTHPSYEHEKEYVAQIATAYGELGIDKIINAFKKGVDIGEGDGIVKVKEIRHAGGDKFKLILTEGKKRQIRRMFNALGYEVIDLVRTRIGKLKLGNLKEGEWERIKAIEE